MITVDTQTESAEDVRQAFEALGYEVPEIEEEVPSTEVPVEEKVETPAKPGAPGEKIPAEPGAKTEPDSGTGKEKAQEPAVEVPKQEVDKSKTKGGFQAKIDAKTREVARLREELDAALGDKTQARADLEAARAELAALKQPEAVKEPELVRPKLPVAPALEDFDYDNEKFKEAQKQYRAAMDKYETDLEDYQEKRTAKIVADAVAAKDAERKIADEQAAVEQRAQAMYARRDKSAGLYEDFSDMMMAVGKNANTLVDPGQPRFSAVAEDYIFVKSKDPAHLLYYLAKDMVENQGVENQRLSELDGYDLYDELKAIETRMIAEAKGKAAPPKKEEPKPAESEVGQPVVETPAKPATQKVKAPDEPIGPKTVGSRAGAVNSGFDARLRAASDAEDSKAFREILAEQEAAKRAKRA